MTRTFARAGAVLILSLPLAACSAIRSGPPPVRTYRMDYPAPPPLAGAPNPATVRVIPFGIATVYDRQGFVYEDGHHGIADDYYNRWFAPPASMLTDLIARDLAASRRFTAVLRTPSSLPSAYELNGMIEALDEGPQDGCTAHLRLRAILVRVPDRGPRTVILDDVLEASESCSAGDPASFAAATSLAVQHVSEQLQQRLSDAATAAP
jgi:ABC-type uncharacterized transport system auxiliary subunit